MNSRSPKNLTRRQFVSGAAVAAGATLAVPAVITSAKTDSKTVIGEGDYRYQVQHAWPQLPEKFQWQTTHNVAVDGDGFLYVIHEGRADLKDHPSIFVFDPQGKYVRSCGNQFK
jgi:hypothetical protein